MLSHVSVQVDSVNLIYFFLQTQIMLMVKNANITTFDNVKNESLISPNTQRDPQLTVCSMFLRLFSVQ